MWGGEGAIGRVWQNRRCEVLPTRTAALPSTRSGRWQKDANATYAAEHRRKMQQLGWTRGALWSSSTRQVGDGPRASRGEDVVGTRPTGLGFRQMPGGGCEQLHREAPGAAATCLPGGAHGEPGESSRGRKGPRPSGEC